MTFSRFFQTMLFINMPVEIFEHIERFLNVSDVLMFRVATTPIPASAKSNLVRRRVNDQELIRQYFESEYTFPIDNGERLSWRIPTSIILASGTVVRRSIHASLLKLHRKRTLNLFYMYTDDRGNVWEENAYD